MSEPAHWRMHLPRPIRLKSGTFMHTLLDGYRELTNHLHPVAANVFLLFTLQLIKIAASSGQAGDVQIAAILLERYAKAEE